MKKLFVFLFFSVFMIQGCIRHYDERLDRKTRTTSKNVKSDIRKITIDIMVSNVRESMKFYKEIAGFETIATIPDTGTYDFAIIGKGNSEIMLHKSESLAQEIPEFAGRTPGGSIILYIEVDDVLKIYEKAAGVVQILKDLHQTSFGTKEFAMKDKDGYVLIFAEPLSK
ncbi:MAG: VOC family protein [Bacteroidota bacterium]